MSASIAASVRHPISNAANVSGPASSSKVRTALAILRTAISKWTLFFSRTLRNILLISLVSLSKPT
ncbi:unnamed protein product [Chondrus crispus]|uniref:Uncharacterized protein n=1 Tax=Chondrus crispus TaxID=2769 RepID=R7QR97_CHOCR|nr:unnamed protein product [Chondrus crispus]CDF40997.1 unnamed protein product [Chondrus crispus]|eukprot:XP_005711291.1 unnamed protein product [Chondrus crispus]